MKDMGIICGSEEQAKELIIGTDTVYVHSNIKKIEKEDDNEFDTYQYHEVQYGKNEFIELLSKEKNDLGMELAKSKIEFMQQKMINQQLGQQLSLTKIDVLKLKQEVKGGEK